MRDMRRGSGLRAGLSWGEGAPHRRLEERSGASRCGAPSTLEGPL